MDWKITHWLNGSLRHHTMPQHLVTWLVQASVPVVAALTITLWFCSRPGDRTYKRASATALAASAIALGINQIITHIWQRARPFTAHPHQVILLASRSHDPSFPSDHAAASFAIAASVLLYSRRAGLGFVLLAIIVSMSRVMAGVHYPSDVVAGAIIGTAAAMGVRYLIPGPLDWLVSLASKATDPVVAPAWNWVDSRRRRERRPN